MKVEEAFKHMKEVINTAKSDKTNIRITTEYLSRYVITLAEEKEITWTERRVLLEVCQNLGKVTRGELNIDDVFIEAMATYREEHSNVKKKTKKEYKNGRNSKETN